MYTGFCGEERAVLRQAFAATLEGLARACRRVYGDDLVAVAVFGSVGRGTPGPASDIDVLLVATGLPPGRLARMQRFEQVERIMAPRLLQLKAQGIDTFFSPVLKTPEEVRRGSLLFLDMVDDARILIDRNGFLASYLADLGRRLKAGAGRKVQRGQHWHWVFDPEKLARAGNQLGKARVRLKMLDHLFNEGAWSDVVREAQEAVELALRGMLRQIGVEPPKQHDVGALLVEYRDRLPAAVAEQAEELARISLWLRKERESAFHGDIDLIPDLTYGPEDAERARRDAATVVRAAALAIDAPA